jgi:hypothetical protein
LIFHGTKDSVVPLLDGLSLSKLIKPEFLYDFFKINEGDHNDLIKNHKMVLYDKLREFVSYVTKNSYSFNYNNSKQEDINSEFFRKLHPHKGDDEPSFEEQRLDNLNIEMNSNKFVIRNYIEIEINKNNEEEQRLNSIKDKINDENFIQIEIKEKKGLNEEDTELKQDKVDVDNQIKYEENSPENVDDSCEEKRSKRNK